MLPAGCSSPPLAAKYPPPLGGRSWIQGRPLFGVRQSRVGIYSIYPIESTYPIALPIHSIDPFIPPIHLDYLSTWGKEGDPQSRVTLDRGGAIGRYYHENEAHYRLSPRGVKAISHIFSEYSKTIVTF